MPFAKIEDAVTAFSRGEILVVVDDEDRENEGDLIQAAEFATPESLAFFLHHTSGYLCAPITAERASELDLPLMVANNTESQRTAFLVTVDYRHDTSTGISAYDRCATVTSLCGSCPSGRKRKRSCRPSRTWLREFSSARHAAARPARSPSKQKISSLQMRKTRDRCSGVVAVPSVATA